MNPELLTDQELAILKAADSVLRTAAQRIALASYTAPSETSLRRMMHLGQFRSAAETAADGLSSVVIVAEVHRNVYGAPAAQTASLRVAPDPGADDAS